MPLEEFLNTQTYLFLLCFTRIGTAMVIMPGIGDGFVSMRIRALFALSMTAVVFPALLPGLPGTVPPFGTFLNLLIAEFATGLFIGMVGRILAMALDTAGMLISLQSGLSSAQLFNPAMQSQGSLVGVFLTLSGVLLMFVTDLHHMLLAGLYNSYTAFPVGEYLPPGSMYNVISKTVAQAFVIGFQMAAPFILIVTVLYVAMGILSRLMPNIQIFLIAMPIQILASFIVMGAVLGGTLLYWAGWFQEGVDIYYQVRPSGG